MNYYKLEAMLLQGVSNCIEFTFPNIKWKKNEFYY